MSTYTRSQGKFPNRRGSRASRQKSDDRSQPGRPQIAPSRPRGTFADVAGGRVSHSDVPPTANQPLLMQPTLRGPNAKAPAVFPQNIGVVPPTIHQQLIAQNPTAAGLPQFYISQQPQYATQQPINLNPAQRGATNAPQQISGGIHTTPHLIGSVNTATGTISQVPPTSTTAYRGMSMRPSAPQIKRQSKAIKIIDPNTKKEVSMGDSKPEIQQSSAHSQLGSQPSDSITPLMVSENFRNAMSVETDDGKANGEDKQENLKHYEAYEQALKCGCNLTLRYLKFLFFGPPCSGKSSTRKRLLHEIVNLHSVGGLSVSTGVAEANEVIIKKLVSEPAAISSGSKWWLPRKLTNISSNNPCNEEELSIDHLTKLFYHLISKTEKVPGSGSESVTQMPTETLHDSIPSTDSEVHVSALKVEEESEIEIAFGKLTGVLQSDSPEDLLQLLEDLTMINMVDIGGQPTFLELFPALTIGHALYFIFFRLDQELEAHYDIMFRAADGTNLNIHQESYCTEIVLYQSLSTIACFGSHSLPENTKSDSSLKKKEPDSSPVHGEYEDHPSISSRALLFGTYKDKVESERIANLDKELQKKFVQTKLYKENLLLKTASDDMFFSIDNMNGDESELVPIRKDIEGIVNKLFSPTPIPASWLIFRMVLHYLHKPVVSLAQCEEVASRLSMPTPVQEAIWFFHHNIGSLMHYRDIPSMQDTVICDPQVIFDCVSELIINTFKPSNRRIPQVAINAFLSKGQFSLAYINNETECHGISLQQLIDILKYLNILAEIKQHKSLSKRQSSQPMYVMPAVLKFATEKELAVHTSLEVSPLVIHFEGGFVPFGVFCASIAHLITHQNSTWELCDDQMKRNKVTFIIDGAYEATLISHPQRFEVVVSQQQGTRIKRSLEDVCSTVCRTIVETLENVISKMKHQPFGIAGSSCRKPFGLAFLCQLCSNECATNADSHLMIVIEVEDGQLCAKCLKMKYIVPLQEHHLIWFEKNDTKSSSSVADITREGPDRKSLGLDGRLNSIQQEPRQKLDEILDFGNKGVPKDLGEIAECMHEWEGRIADNLDLTSADVAAIKTKYPSDLRQQARSALRMWKDKHGKTATYRNLIGVFENAGYKTYADQVHYICYGGTEDFARHATEISPSLENSSFNWCLFTGEQDLSVQSATTTRSGTHSAGLPCGVILWKKRQVTVLFTETTVHLLHKWKQTAKGILQLANKWHKLQKEPNYIPLFIGGRIDEDADIIVELNECGINKSLPGNARKACSDEPTMWLDLSGTDTAYNQYLVVHEFGHALGLGHEHQRSNFRVCINPFIDVAKMHQRVTEKRFKDWETDVQLDVNSASEYDPDSVMHYWFEREWLKYGYHDKKTIDAHFKAGVLSEKMKNALLGVHKNCSKIWPTKPSAKDLQFINGVYGTI